MGFQSSERPRTQRFPSGVDAPIFTWTLSNVWRVSVSNFAFSMKTPVRWSRGSLCSGLASSYLILSTMSPFPHTVTF